MNQIPNTHVTSLELSRRLKELGVKKESLFYWEEMDVLGNISYVVSCEDWDRQGNSWDTVVAPAYLASELGEMLPSDIKTYKYDDGRWFCDGSKKYDDNAAWLQANTQAEAMGLMLAHLIEHHLISVEELGK